jgi:integrase
MGNPGPAFSPHPGLEEENRRARLSPYVTAAVRLLMFTGCRLREILHLQWQHVDMDRGVLLLPDSKTGKKTVVLAAPALAVLASLGRNLPICVKPRASVRPRSTWSPRPCAGLKRLG